jgi:hypothetical protein
MEQGWIDSFRIAEARRNSENGFRSPQAEGRHPADF